MTTTQYGAQIMMSTQYGAQIIMSTQYGAHSIEHKSLQYISHLSILICDLYICPANLFVYTLKLLILSFNLVS